ncbi:MAG: Nucleotide binding protein putative, containing domain [Mucilaginibacter sp.]|nr:Nucleotide binding protein putative, containing domain [Mucilaginibacter sp.]
MIFDTNILIYLSKYTLTPEKIFKENAAISVITKIEALGFPFKYEDEHILLLGICNELRVIPLTDQIAQETINLRRNFRVKLPDAIIYATALVENVPLLTNNIDDFKSLDRNVKLINPFDL